MVNEKFLCQSSIVNHDQKITFTILDWHRKISVPVQYSIISVPVQFRKVSVPVQFRKLSVPVRTP